MKCLRALVLCLAALGAFAHVHAQPLANLAQAYTALEAGRYADVEALYARLRQERARTPQGDFVFADFGWKVYWYSSSDPKDLAYWPTIDARTRAWIDHSPKSHVAAMTRAFALAYRGMHVQARGSWKDADQFALEARRLLDQSRREGASDPLWHAARLRVAALEGLPRTEVVSLIHAAIAVDPLVMRVWLEAAIALTPNGRNSEDLPWLMRLATQRTAATEGTSMYARVLAATLFHFDEFATSPFTVRGMEWPVLDQSFQDWKQRYPAGYNVNLHAAMACAARDRETTARLMGQIKPGGEGGVWKDMGGNDFQKICRDWAAPPATDKPKV